MKIRDSLIAILALAATPALAFDLPPQVEAPEYTGSIASADGWYIRGDLGYNGSIDGDNPTYKTFDFNTDTTTSNTFDASRLSTNFSLNAGGGYQFNDYFRSDLTLDYFRTSFKGKSNWEDCAPGGGFQCKYRGQDMTALGLLANGYVDLGTYMGFTPYVGAGAGMSYVKWGDVDYYARGSDKGLDPDLIPREGAASWRFTYALMAGTSYDLTDRMKIDFGYRFSQIAGGDMFQFNGFEDALGAFGAKGKDKGLTRHEFRTGLRLTTW
jgi:opacity protein-like surface antigen